VKEAIEQLISRIGSSSPEEHRKAAREIRELARKGLTPEDGDLLLRAAAEPMPAGKSDFDDPAGVLVAAAAESPSSRFIPLIRGLFSRYPKPARREALYLLARLPEREAAVAFMALLKEHQAALPRLYSGPLQQSLRHPDVYFPELLAYAANPVLREMVFNLALAYCSKGAVDPAMLSSRSQTILDRYSELHSEMLPLQRGQGLDWMWTDEYLVLRGEAEVLLDLLGYVPAASARAELGRAVEEWQDSRLKCFAVISALRQGADIEGRHLIEVARSAEMRNILYRMLRDMGKVALYPREFLSQEAFAESDMVNWLTFPSELGRVPDEIQLMTVVSFETSEPGGDAWDYYVFRFRTNAPHWAAKDGWLAGVSGAFKRTESPTPDGATDTFSRFEAWDSRSPQEHVGEVQQVMGKIQDRDDG
jgi:hypothetical protein